MRKYQGSWGCIKGSIKQKLLKMQSSRKISIPDIKVYYKAIKHFLSVLAK